MPSVFSLLFDQAFKLNNNLTVILLIELYLWLTRCTTTYVCSISKPFTVTLPWWSWTIASPSSSASELVDWLVLNGEASSREEGVELGQVRIQYDGRRWNC